MLEIPQGQFSFFFFFFHLRGFEIPQENIYCLLIILLIIFLGKGNESNYN